VKDLECSLAAEDVKDLIGFESIECVEWVEQEVETHENASDKAIEGNKAKNRDNLKRKVEPFIEDEWEVKSNEDSEDKHEEETESVCILTPVNTPSPSPTPPENIEIEKTSNITEGGMEQVKNISKEKDVKAPNNIQDLTKVDIESRSEEKTVSVSKTNLRETNDEKTAKAKNTERKSNSSKNNSEVNVNRSTEERIKIAAEKKETKKLDSSKNKSSVKDKILGGSKPSTREVNTEKKDNKAKLESVKAHPKIADTKSVQQKATATKTNAKENTSNNGTKEKDITKKMISM
jgi:hypothetical protein